MKWPWFKKDGKTDVIAWQPPDPLVTREAPRQILASDFKSLKGGLPIQGGWGYTKEDACIICKDDPLNEPGIPFDGAGVEYAFVEKRCYEELIIFCAEGKKHSGIKWKLKRQALVGGDNGRRYDHMIFEITCFREQDWEVLKAEYEQGESDPDFDTDAHWRKNESLKHSYDGEFWFDITSFFGK